MSTAQRLIATTVLGAALVGSAATGAHAAAPTVDVIRTVEVDNAVPFVGCNGEPVTTTFNGPIHSVRIVLADGSVRFSLEANEMATWTQNGVDYTMRNTFSLEQKIDPGAVLDIVNNGTGYGSDGSKVRAHDVQHLVVSPAGDLVVWFDRGSFTCS